jgi:glycosyltransferase involved in cell wall biosynthesis
MTKLFYIVTVPETAYSLLRGQLAYFRQQTLDVAVISSDGPLLWDTKDREQITIHPLPLEREINIYADIHALLAMIVLLQREKPEIVNASTPKAGFLGMIASRFCNVPVRIYQLRGLRLETATGFLRVILLTAQRIAARCAQVVVCDSQSLRDRYLSLGLAPAHKVRVLGAGSSNGVDPDRFLPSSLVLERAHQHRDELRLPPDNLVIGYVGRLTRDKGVSEMVAAFLRLIY